MAAALDELRGLLERPPSPVSEHARRLDDALFGERAVVGAGSRAPGVDVEIEALRGYLRELASTHESLGGEPESFEAFVARLERQLDAPAVLLREAGGVLLAPMHTLHGLRFDFVAVGGLIEGEFPAPQRSTALLDRDARDSLNGAGLDLPPRRGSRRTSCGSRCARGRTAGSDSGGHGSTNATGPPRPRTTSTCRAPTG